MIFLWFSYGFPKDFNGTAGLATPGRSVTASAGDAACGAGEPAVPGHGNGEDGKTIGKP